LFRLVFVFGFILFLAVIVILVVAVYEDLGEVEAEAARKFMKEAIYQARLAHSSGQVTFISHDLH
jgi:hypothetical protein